MVYHFTGSYHIREYAGKFYILFLGGVGHYEFPVLIVIDDDIFTKLKSNLTTDVKNLTPYFLINVSDHETGNCSHSVTK